MAVLPAAAIIIQKFIIASFYLNKSTVLLALESSQFTLDFAARTCGYTREVGISCSKRVLAFRHVTGIEACERRSTDL